MARSRYNTEYVRRNNYHPPDNIQELHVAVWFVLPRLSFYGHNLHISIHSKKNLFFPRSLPTNSIKAYRHKFSHLNSTYTPNSTDGCHHSSVSSIIVLCLPTCLFISTSTYHYLKHKDQTLIYQHYSKSMNSQHAVFWGLNCHNRTCGGLGCWVPGQSDNT